MRINVYPLIFIKFVRYSPTRLTKPDKKKSPDTRTRTHTDALALAFAPGIGNVLLAGANRMVAVWCSPEHIYFALRLWLSVVNGPAKSPKCSPRNLKRSRQNDTTREETIKRIKHGWCCSTTERPIASANSLTWHTHVLRLTPLYCLFASCDNAISWHKIFFEIFYTLTHAQNTDPNQTEIENLKRAKATKRVACFSLDTRHQMVQTQTNVKIRILYAHG